MRNSDSDQLIDELAGVRLNNVFNPYRETCGFFDRCDAAEIRKDLLRQILGVVEVRGVDDIWVGRDLGYRGGRRTGVAFTDDVQYEEVLKRWG